MVSLLRKLAGSACRLRRKTVRLPTLLASYDTPMFGQYFREILAFWWRHLGAIFLVTAPFALAGEALQWALGPTMLIEDDRIGGFNLGSIVALMLLRPLAEAALMIQLGALQQGKARGLLACLLPALMLYPALLVTYLLIGIGVSLGWLAFIFPALWVYTRLCIAPFLVVLRGSGPIQALRDSFQLTRSQQWSLLFTLLSLFLFALMVSSTFSGLLVALLGNTGGTMLITALVSALMSATLNVAVLRYWNLSEAEQSG